MIVAVLAGCAFAQGPGMMGGTPPDPQTMIQRRVDRLATLLSLTDAQKASAITIFTNAYTASQPVQASFQTNRQSLSTAVKNNDTASIDKFAGAIGTLNGQLLAIESKADAAFYALLTTDQRAKYDTMPRGGMGPGGFGPRMRGRPRQ